MIKQSLAFNDILEKKFKILRTSIMLGNLKNREQTLVEYEETAREIDKIKKNVYEELLASKMYTTVTLEEEEKRLDDLITFIENRIKERNDFVDDYIKITSNFLDGLDRVSLENELDSYKNRYKNINEYLINCDEIKNLNLKLKELRDMLEDKYEDKANNELINSKLEEELIDEFSRIISDDKYYTDLNYTDIDLELIKLEESISDKKSVLDTFISSYQALVNAGISGVEREEYSSYVYDAKLNYYDDIEKRWFLNIYKLVLDKQVDYENLFNKRSNIENILEDRESIRGSLEINNRDILDYFSNLCKEQYSIIKSQKFNIDDIDKLILEISDCEARLEQLEKENSRTEILDLINEYSVETVEVEKIELPDEKKIFEEVEKTVEKKEDNIIDTVVQKNVVKSVEKKPSNMVVKIKDPIKINVKTASDTAKLVMKKVVIVLEPKKFGNQRDKLREAELELEREKRELKKQKEKNAVLESKEAEINNKEDVLKDVVLGDEEIFDAVDNGSNVIVNEQKNDDVISTLENSNDIFLDDDMFEDESTNMKIDTTGSIGIELNTKKITDDKSIKETKELTEIKINASDPSNISIPTEIFIEDSPIEKELDLFKETDPFLDDNEFELADEKNSGVVKSSMPFLGKIGTVKPNNALSKIEDVVKESDDIILPNLGLVDEAKSEVPIVSENYIS